jgi:hypothetical protein
MMRKESSNYHRWRPEEVEALKANWRSMTAAELAIETGHTKLSAQSRLHRLGIRLRERTKPAARVSAWNFEPMQRWCACLHSKTPQ